MKIGFDAYKAFKYGNNYGAYSKSIIRILSQNHPENNYILYTSSLGKDPMLRAMLSPQHVEVRTPALIVSRMNMGNIWRSTILGNTALKDGIEVFHGLNNELPLVMSKKLKTVVTIHHLLFIRYPHLYGNFDINFFKRRYKHACKVADKIVATSKQTAEDIQSFLGISAKKIEVICQPCHPDFKKEYAPYDLRMLCDKYDLPENFILTTAQEDSTDNGILQTLKALASVKSKVDIPLVVVGKPHNRYLSEASKRIKEEQMGEQIIFLDDVPVKDLAMIFQMCQLYVNASNYPCDTTPIKDALYSKVPVICSRIPEFIEAGGLAPLYIQPGNTNELANTIQNAVNNPSLTSNMINQGEIHTQQFSDKVIAGQLNELYSSLY